MSEVNLGSFADALIDVLQEYNDEVIVASKEAVEEVSEECRQEITRNSPRGEGDGGKNGHYADDWKKKIIFQSGDEIVYTVYNKRHYQLTHLLEYGHEKWLWGNYTGGRVKPIPHIRPAEANAEKNLVKAIERKLS